MDFEQKRFEFTPTRIDGAIKFASACFERGVVKRWTWIDTIQPKLRLVVGPRSAKYYCRESINGKERLRTLGAAGPKGIKLTAARENCVSVAAIAHSIGTAPKARKRVGITVSQVWEEYIQAARTGKFTPRGRVRRPLAKKTVRCYISNYNAHLKDRWGQEDVATLARNAEAIIDSLPNKGGHDGKSLANNVRQIIRNMFTYLKRKKAWDNQNPTDEVLKYDVPQREVEISPEEAAKILVAIDKSGHFRELFLFLALTGRRMENGLELRWDQIKGDKIFYKSESIKTNKPEKIPVTKEIKKILDSRRKLVPQESPYVWPNLKDPQKPAVNCGYAWGRVRKASGVDIVLHSLRHIAVTTASDAGSDVSGVSAMSGHTTLDALQRYLHARPSAALASMKAVAAMWEEAGKLAAQQQQEEPQHA